MYQGSCLCGSVTYEITAEPAFVTNCHCRMCQKQHGAAFATYVTVKKGELVYLTGEDSLSSYNSSSTIMRKFCALCGSNIEWSGSPEYPQWVSVPLTTLDTKFVPKEVGNIFQESKCTWI